MTYLNHFFYVYDANLQMFPYFITFHDTNSYTDITMDEALTIWPILLEFCLSCRVWISSPQKRLNHNQCFIYLEVLIN